MSALFRSMLVAGLCACAPGLALMAMLISQQAAAQPRLRPPAQVLCPRDLLTAFAGEVLRYEPGSQRTRLLIHTDEQTSERVVVEHGGAKLPITHYLLEGRTFEPRDMAQIEQSPGKLHPGMRVVAWVCSDGRQAVIDWHPPLKP